MRRASAPPEYDGRWEVGYYLFIIVPSVILKPDVLSSVFAPESSGAV